MLSLIITKNKTQNPTCKIYVKFDGLYLLKLKIEFSLIAIKSIFNHVNFIITITLLINNKFLVTKPPLTYISCPWASLKLIKTTN